MPISRPEEVLNNVRSTAERSGAAEAETFFEFVRFVEVRYREGEVELLQQSAITGLGLRVLRDQKMGFLYTTNLNRTVLDELVVRTIALASQASPRDENRLPDQQFPPQTNLEIEDAYADRITPQDLIALAKALEDNALLVNKVKTTQTARAG
jgi:PmbA protein